MSSPNPNAGFRYDPLDLSREEFRLIRMTRTHPNALSCEMIVDWLPLHTIHKALSYQWGEKLPARQILVNGARFTVRNNLYSFLETIRDDTETWFFIDQICIDQSNVQERNHQVKFMRQVYKNADEVVAWLGPEADRSSLAMAYISDKASFSQEYTQHRAGFPDFESFRNFYPERPYYLFTLKSPPLQRQRLGEGFGLSVSAALLDSYSDRSRNPTHENCGCALRKCSSRVVKVRGVLHNPKNFRL
ncbi:hypothetical protein BU16DRAFT_235801 [Lophium mytilinum]|uniref:Heterokaryon incompatibility domain-containing protein n=1 Tax=Lophium mytilinum TaxID=390894 RepID=A0A6A6R9E9_9PEZI|nr:hypothetical protein BU16DRAFT_235801 [Lophium mytilinum]